MKSDTKLVFLTHEKSVIGEELVGRSFQGP